jgi:hypothetical protein
VAGTCPNCGAVQIADERFCEVCGLDYTTGAMPTAPQPVAASSPPVVDPAPVQAPAGDPVPTGWSVVVRADREWWQANPSVGGAQADIAFPDPAPADRTIELTESPVTIGRPSASRGIDPAIDCSEPVDDTAVSRRHAELRWDEGGEHWNVVDVGSTNGTWVGDTQLTPNEPAPLIPGDVVRLGGWTAIELHGP